MLNPFKNVDPSKILTGVVLVGSLGINLLNNKNEVLKREKMKADVVKEVLKELSKSKG